MLEYIKTRRASRQTVHNCYTELSLLCYAGLSIHPVSWEEVFIVLVRSKLLKSQTIFLQVWLKVFQYFRETTSQFPTVLSLIREDPWQILPQDTSCCEDTWILHPGPLKGSIYTSIHTGQLHYVNLFFWLIIVKTKVKVRWNSILSVQFSEEKKSEVNSRQQVLPCAVEENHQELVYKLRNEIIVLQHISYLSSYKTK